MTTFVVADLGGTHARFALAKAERGKVAHIGEPVSLLAADHGDFESAWAAFRSHVGHDLPGAAVLAVAASVGGDIICLTNNPWVIEPATFAERIGMTRHIVINDFAAVAHAVDAVDDSEFIHLCGPQHPLPVEGTISIIGPGTGLGISFITRDGGDSRIHGTEGGHFDFAPVDAVDDAILSYLRQRFGRTSARLADENNVSLRKLCRIKARERHVAGAGHMSGAVFMRLAHIDDGAGFIRDDAAEIVVLDRRDGAAAATSEF